MVPLLKLIASATSYPLSVLTVLTMYHMTSVVVAKMGKISLPPNFYLQANIC